MLEAEEVLDNCFKGVEAAAACSGDIVLCVLAGIVKPKTSTITVKHANTVARSSIYNNDFISTLDCCAWLVVKAGPSVC